MNLANPAARLFFRWLGYVLLSVHFAVIVLIWQASSFSLLGAGGPSLLLSVGQLCGLLAAGCALLQFMLMGRSPWLEQAFGLERLARLHRLNGYATITFIIIHPMLMTLAYAGFSHTNLIAQYIQFLTKFDDVWKALIAEILFVSVVATSVYIVRKHLPYERWYLIHLMVYAAILLAFGHQVHVGGSFVSSPGFTAYWYGLYVFVGLNVLVGRFLLPTYKYLRYGFRIDEIVTETHDTVSVYIGGRGLERFKARPGQFVIVWIWAKGFWWEEHPFSISALPANGRLRITVKNAGDYTAKLPQVKIGSKVIVAGPYGSFTPHAASRPRLYLAGGVGITPIRAMIEAQQPQAGNVLIYGNKTGADIIFDSELAAHEARGLEIHHVLSHEPQHGGETGYIDVARVQRLVPDFKTREVYLCGPPAMMNGLIGTLEAAGLPAAQLHYERFALHPVS